MTSDPYFKRLYFQSSHRGTKELDIILGRFAEKYLHTLSKPQLEVYEQLLEVPEATLFDWLTGQQHVEEPYNTAVFEMIKSYNP